MNHIRNVNHIHVYGEDIPDPVSSFQELFQLYGFSSALKKNISDMNFITPTAVQIQTIPAVIHVRFFLI